MTALSISHLTKRYGTHVAVSDLSLEVNPGTIYGLLGRNGAGKSSTITCALGLVSKTAGRISFFGRTLDARALGRIAYVPELNCLDGWMTTKQHSEFRSRCYKSFDRRRLKELIDYFEIDPDRAVNKLSKGQRQTVALALAFAQRPELMVLDEPSSGLDPVMQRRLLATIVGAASDGATVLFSSHHIGHVEQAAERIAIIDRGQIALESDVDDLRARRFVLEAIFEDGRLEQRFVNGDVALVEAQLRSLSPVTLKRRAMSLEQIFFKTIGDTEAQKS